jgi:hypothetical protein
MLKQQAHFRIKTVEVSIKSRFIALCLLAKLWTSCGIGFTLRLTVLFPPSSHALSLPLLTSLHLSLSTLSLFCYRIFNNTCWFQTKIGLRAPSAVYCAVRTRIVRHESESSSSIVCRPRNGCGCGGAWVYYYKTSWMGVVLRTHIMCVCVYIYISYWFTNIVSWKCLVHLIRSPDTRIRLCLWCMVLRNVKMSVMNEKPKFVFIVVKSSVFFSCQFVGICVNLRFCSLTFVFAFHILEIRCGNP